VVKKRLENAGPVGEVEVWAEAAVAIMATAATVSVRDVLRIRSSLECSLCCCSWA
jgi:hypothetical protein